MNDRLNAGSPVNHFAAIPVQWDEDPTAQLVSLRDEVIRQRDHPSTVTVAFMDAASKKLERLPAEYFPPERAEALIDIATFYFVDAQTDLAVRTGASAVRAAVLGGHRGLEARARMGYGVFLQETYDFAAAMRELAQALEIAREQGDTVREGRVLNNLAGWFSDAGQCAEALAMFERLAELWRRVDDPRALQLALQGAALAALRMGRVPKGLILMEKSMSVESDDPVTALERLWFVQSTLTHCELLIQVGRSREALIHARTAQKLAESSGLEHAKNLANIAEAVSAFSSGHAGSEAIERVIARAKDESPSIFDSAVVAGVRAFERADKVDQALSLQRELLAFNKVRKFEEVRRALGHSSLEEVDGAARLAQLGAAVDRKVSDLVNAAINQALRAGYDHERIFRVSRLAELFASSEGWPQDRVQAIGLAAKLIDLGTMVISDELISKARDLSAGERKLVDEHARFGAELLANTRLALFEPCVPVVRFHHERWDGTGPFEQEGDDIPTEARLVALCDSFDALTHERPWRQAFSRTAALHIIGEEAGTHFDPNLAGRFIAWVRTETAKVDDFEAYLAVEAMENHYVRTRKRIEQLVRTSV